MAAADVKLRNITLRYTILEYNGHVVMVRVSMKNDKRGKRFTLKNYKN